jgi:hypothetical protein
MSAISIIRRAFFALLFAIGIIASHTSAVAQADPLPSWNDGAVKKSITDFVARVTTQGEGLVPIEQRIATFDNDGTLWTEQPYYFQFAFALDRVKALAPRHPEWKSKRPFRALLEGEKKALEGAGKDGLLQIIAVTHSGMTVEDFTKTVVDWTATARDPRFNRFYIELVYQPMLELAVVDMKQDWKTVFPNTPGEGSASDRDHELRQPVLSMVW